MTRIGMLTPSSNTALEPATARLLHGTPEVTAHFARFPVTEISLSAAGRQQFDSEPILAAASLLAHARVDAIAWNGTSASWLGLDRDQALCAAITARTGIAATTCVLGLHALYEKVGVRRLGLVSPYTDDVQRRIAANYRRHGIDCIAEAHGGISDNFAFAGIGSATIEAMIREVAQSRPDAVVVLCTNMDAVDLAAGLERELDLPVLDSIAATLWSVLELLHLPKEAYRRFGRMFSL